MEPPRRGGDRDGVSGVGLAGTFSANPEDCFHGSNPKKWIAKQKKRNYGESDRFSGAVRRARFRLVRPSSSSNRRERRARSTRSSGPATWFARLRDTFATCRSRNATAARRRIASRATRRCGHRARRALDRGRSPGLHRVAPPRWRRPHAAGRASWTLMPRSSPQRHDLFAFRERHVRHRLPAPAREHQSGGVAERPGLAAGSRWRGGTAARGGRGHPGNPAATTPAPPTTGTPASTPRRRARAADRSTTTTSPTHRSPGARSGAFVDRSCVAGPTSRMSTRPWRRYGAALARPMLRRRSPRCGAQAVPHARGRQHRVGMQ